jgi:hypothetical protein
MADFERLPMQIRKTVQQNISQDEQIKMCFLAGSSPLSNRDYIVITSRRVLVMDERTIGCLGRSYVNLKENVPIDEITSIDISRTFMNKLLGQANMGLQAEKYKYLINNGSKKEIEAAAELISDLAHLVLRKVN